MRAWGIVPALLVVACGGRQGGADDAASVDSGSCDGSAAGCGDGTDTAGGTDGGSAPLDATGPDASAAAFQAATFLENAGHTSAIADAGATPPLRRTWTVTLPGVASYPLVANGLVFVTTNATTSAQSSTHPQLVAIDSATGKTAWSADLGTISAATAAYDEGRVFSMDEQSKGAPLALRAFDAATGKLAWTANPVGQGFFDAPPVAYRGIVYVQGIGVGGTLYAYDESSGTLLWDVGDNGGEGAPAVSDDGVFVSAGCESVIAFDRTTGAKLWQTPSTCYDGQGNATPVVFGTTVYAVDSVSGNLELNAKTGAKLGSFTGDLPPAFDGSLGFVVSGGTLFARTGGLASAAWTFAGDGRLATVPFVAGGTVYVGSSEGNFYALDEATGAVVWSENVGYPLVTQERLEPRVAIAGAGGVVLVPAGPALIAYESGGAADAGTHEAGADGGCTYTLTPMSPVPTGEYPQGLAIGDLNGDGHPDFAVTYDDDLAPPPNCYVMAIPGRGDGTFGAAGPPYLVGGGASAVAAGDFNRDGKIDLAVANTYDTPYSVGVLLGNGDGTFQPQVTYATDPDPFGIAVGDFDKNGTLDFAVAAGAALDILLGNGDGTFAPKVTYPCNGPTYGVAVVDIDGDGVLDAVLANTYDNTVSVLRGKGDGTFQPETPYATGTEPSSVALGDVDGDGHLDIAVANYGDDTVGVLYGHGDGTFDPQVAYPAGLNAWGVVIVDLNRDGLADLAVTNSGEATVSILLDTGARQFAPQFVIGVGKGPTVLEASDLNADGWPDLAAVDDDDNSVAVFLGGCK
jgi:outer membrane protein assembly factor BamB